MITNLIIFLSGLLVAILGVVQNNIPITILGCTMILSAVLFHIADKLKDLKLK